MTDEDLEGELPPTTKRLGMLFRTCSYLLAGLDLYVWLKPDKISHTPLAVLTLTDLIGFIGAMAGLFYLIYAFVESREVEYSKWARFGWVLAIGLAGVAPFLLA
jgi:hypothetical protein